MHMRQKQRSTHLADAARNFRISYTGGSERTERFVAVSARNAVVHTQTHIHTQTCHIGYVSSDVGSIIGAPGALDRWHQSDKLIGFMSQCIS